MSFFLTGLLSNPFLWQTFKPSDKGDADGTTENPIPPDTNCIGA